jgi:hypothetical protein
MVDYTDLDGPNGTENNMGGTQQVFYIAPVRDILTIQKPVASPSTLDAIVSITTAHVMKTGKKFTKVYVTMDTGEIEDEPTGDRDARGTKSTFKFRTPGQNAELLGFMSQAKNDRFIVLVPLADGTLRQMGSEQFYAEMMGKVITGKNSSGYRGIEGEITCFGPTLLLYTAAVPLTPGV